MKILNKPTFVSVSVVYKLSSDVWSSCNNTFAINLLKISFFSNKTFDFQSIGKEKRKRKKKEIRKAALCTFVSDKKKKNLGDVGTQASKNRKKPLFSTPFYYMCLNEKHVYITQSSPLFSSFFFVLFLKLIKNSI